MTKLLNNADVKGYIAQTAVTSSLLKTDSNGKLVAATAGTDYQAPTTALLPAGGTAGQILSKINATDYNTQWIDNFAAQLKHEVKLGATLSKGAAVYVSSANGTNMIVSAASNASEATSSKTLGLLETGGVTNDLVKVITEGLLAGLDTSTATAGDPVWLGVNGALIFGLANKPVAPAHMVFIGIVTRAQSNNGEIFVKVQNGFELDELHNVSISSLANNQILVWESATSLWKNKTIAAALGYTPADDAAVVKLTGDQTVAGVKTFTSVVNAPTLSLNGGVLSGNNIVSMRSNPTGGQFRIEKSDGSLSAYPFYIGVDGTALAYYYNALGALKVLLHTDGTSYFGNSLSVGYSTYGATSYMLDVNGTANIVGALTGTTATFSSTITGNRNDNTTNVSAVLQNSYINAGNLIKFVHNSGGSTTNGYIGHGGDSTGNFVIINNGINALTLARDTGAATFSSTISLADYININGSTNAYLNLNAANAGGNEAGVYFKIGGTAKWEQYTAANDGNLSFWSNGNGIRFYITPTGGAVFASSITAGGIITAPSQFQLSGASLPTGLNLGVGGNTPLVEFHANFRNSQNTTYRGGELRIDTRDGQSLFSFLSRSAGSTVDNFLLSLSEAGQLKLQTYTSATSYTGTAAGYLAFDSSGNVITVAGVSSTDNTKLPLTGGALTGPLSIAGTGTYLGDWGYSTLTLTDTGGYPGIFFKNGNNIWINRRNGADNAMDWAYSTNASAQGTGTFTQKMRLASDEWWVSTYPGYKMRITGGDVIDCLNGSSVTTLYLQYQANTGGNVNIAAGKFTFENTNNRLLFSKTSGTLISHGSMTDAIGYNADYGTYIGSPVGGTYYIYANGTFNDNGTIRTLIHSGNIGSQEVNRAYRGIIQDTRSGQRTPNDYDDYRVSWEFTNQIVSGWHSAMTLQGWHDGYAAWQIIGWSDGGTSDNWYLRSGNGASWGSLRTIIHSGNIAGQTVAGLNADFLGTGTVSLSRGYSCVLRNENGSGGAVTYSPLLHMAASDTMWQIQGTYGTSGNGTLYFRQGYSGSWGNWLTMLSSANYNSYSPTLTGGGASGTWGINVTGSSRSLLFSGDSAKQFSDGQWAGGGSYPGYAFTGGNSRFGFSSTSGVIDVYTDGNFYATDSSYLVLHTGNSPYAYNMNQYVRTTDSPSFAEAIFGTTGGATNQGIQIRYQNYVSGYGRIRFYQSDSNHATIHVFSSSWQNGTLAGHSTGAINIEGQNGVTFGAWNDADAYIVKGGQTYARGYRGIGNVSGTGEATYHPAGMYSVGTQWLYGALYRNSANTYEQGQLYFNSNYGYGMVGLYSSYRYQAIFAMGDSYKLPVDGTTTGSLYGLAWSHPNAGGVASNLNTHGMIVMENGNFLAAISGRIRTRDEIYSGGWMYSSGGNTGWLQDNQNQGIRAAAYNSYFGTIATYGANTNGYGGYTIMNNYRIMFMQNSSGDFGFYQNDDWRWNLFYNRGNNCWGIGTDNTYSGDGFRCIKYGSAEYGWTTWSDRRAKENISTITGALNTVLSMRGVYYNYIKDEAKVQRVGFIAQELMEVLPQAVRYAEEVDEYNVNYDQIVSVLAEAIKEQDSKIQLQEEKISLLQAQLQTLLN